MDDTPVHGPNRGHPMFDDTDSLREEIEERTRNGETCKQISDALQARGIKVSSKTISRRRVEWGLRKRVYKLGYTPNRIRGKGPPRSRAPGEEICLVGKENADYRKEEISRLTNEGKTADEIAAILTEQGVTLKSGASTIWRLQTYWKLVPYDAQRAKGNGKYKNKKNPKEKVQKAKKAKVSEQGNQGVSADIATLHYPVNCAFGPYRRIASAQYDSPYARAALPNTRSEPIQIDSGPESDSDSDAEPLPMFDDNAPLSNDVSATSSAQPHARQQPQPSRGDTNLQRPRGTMRPLLPATHSAVQPSAAPAIIQSTDLMSAELLVDLATSALGAANTLKNLMLAVQMQRPAPGSLGVLPPSAEDIAAARRKFAEAAKVAIDLALDE